jgi:hypothetical protein
MNTQTFQDYLNSLQQFNIISTLSSNYQYPISLSLPNQIAILPYKSITSYSSNISNGIKQRILKNFINTITIKVINRMLETLFSDMSLEFAELDESYLHEVILNYEKFVNIKLWVIYSSKIKNMQIISKTFKCRKFNNFINQTLGSAFRKYLKSKYFKRDIQQMKLTEDAEDIYMFKLCSTILDKIYCQ